MSRKTFVLEYTEDYDFDVLGIFCTYRDYKLCFELNNVMEADFVRLDDIEQNFERKGSSGLFPVFRYDNSDGEEYYIIGNKGQHGCFAPEYKQVDFFMMIRNKSRLTELNDLIRMIRSIKKVSSVIELDPAAMKSADSFLMI